MSYAEVLDQLAGKTEADVIAVWEALAAGRIDMDEAVAAVVALVAPANATAAALADEAVAATLSVRLGGVFSPLGLSPGDEGDRLTAGALTLLTAAASTPDPVGRVGRFGRAEPLGTAQSTFGDALDVRAEYVAGWRRGLSSGACELCRWLEKDGYVYPTGRKMHHHTGCQCQQIIVTKEWEG